MTTETLNQHIEITPGISGGKPRIAGHRITVENIVIWHERLGKSADEIASDYDITLADVYAALAYYFDHRNEIDRSLEESRAFVNALRQNPLRSFLKRCKSGIPIEHKEVMANSDLLVADPSTEIIFEVSEDEVDGVTRQVRLDMASIRREKTGTTEGHGARRGALPLRRHHATT